MTQLDIPRRVLSGTTARRGTPKVDGTRFGMTQVYATPAQLAERWGQTPETVRRSIRRGLLRAIRLPGARKLLVPMSQVFELEAPFDPNRLKISTH